jgi:hypothetical protein
MPGTPSTQSARDVSTPAPTVVTPGRRVVGRARSRRLVALTVGALGSCGLLTACGDDDSAAEISAGPQTCSAYDEAQVAVDQFAAVDFLATTQVDVEAALADVVASVEHLSEVTGADDADVLQDIDGQVAEIPAGEDPNDDLLSLNVLRDSRDIIVADVRTWLDHTEIDCG